MRIPNIEALMQALSPISGSPAYRPAPQGDPSVAAGQALMEPNNPTEVGPRVARTIMMPPIDDSVPASEGTPGIATRAGELATSAVKSGAASAAGPSDMASAGRAVSNGVDRQALAEEADRSYREALAKLEEAASMTQPTRPGSPIGHKEALGGLVAAGLLKAAGVPDRVIGDMARGFLGVRTAQAEAEFQQKTAEFASNRSRMIAEAETLKGKSESANAKLLRADAQEEIRQKTATETINRLIGLASAGRTDPEVFEVAIHFAKANGVEFDGEYVKSLVTTMQKRKDTVADIDRMTKMMPQMFQQAAKVRENPQSAIVAASFILGMARKYPDAFPTLFNLDPEEVRAQMESVLTVGEERRQQLELRKKQIEQTMVQNWARIGISRDQADAMIAESIARQYKIKADTEKVLNSYATGESKDAAAATKRINGLVAERDKAARALAGFEAEAEAMLGLLEDPEDAKYVKAQTSASKLRAEIEWIENQIAVLEQAAGIRTPSILKGPLGGGDGAPRARGQQPTNPYAPVSPVGAIEGTFNGKPFRLIPR